MVGLRAKVLGQMGWTTSPYQRACALSCPSLAIFGPGSYGAPAFILLLVARFCFPLSRGLCFAPSPRCAGPRVMRPCLTPVGGHTLANAYVQSPRARRTGFYHRVGAPTTPTGQGSDPSLCPGPTPQGVSYVQASGLGSYIRNIIPDGWAALIWSTPNLSGRCWPLLLKVLQLRTQTYEDGVSL